MLELDQPDSRTKTTAVSTSQAVEGPNTILRKQEKIKTEANDIGANTPRPDPSFRTMSTMRSSNGNSNPNLHQLSILPRINSGFARRDSNDFERKGPEGGRKRFRWKLLTMGGALLFLFVWLLGPRERRQKVWDTVGSVYPYGKGEPFPL